MYNQARVAPSSLIDHSRRWLLLVNEQATAQLAYCLTSSLQVGDILCLSGMLGMGKTTFTRFLIQALSSSSEEVPSPTFTLVQRFETTIGLVWHFDLFRITEPLDIIELGWEEAITEGITVVEWPDRIEHQLPIDRLDVTFDLVRTEHFSNARWVRLKGQGSWAKRLSMIKNI